VIDQPLQQRVDFHPLNTQTESTVTGQDCEDLLLIIHQQHCNINHKLFIIFKSCSRTNVSDLQLCSLYTHIVLAGISVVEHSICATHNIPKEFLINIDARSDFINVFSEVWYHFTMMGRNFIKIFLNFVHSSRSKIS